jgi:hypothetical protein
VALVCTTNNWPPVLNAADQDWIDKNVVAVCISEPVWSQGQKRPRLNV